MLRRRPRELSLEVLNHRVEVCVVAAADFVFCFFEVFANEKSDRIAHTIRSDVWSRVVRNASVGSLLTCLQPLAVLLLQKLHISQCDVVFARSVPHRYAPQERLDRPFKNNMFNLCEAFKHRDYILPRMLVKLQFDPRQMQLCKDM